MIERMARGHPSAEPPAPHPGGRTGWRRADGAVAMVSWQAQAASERTVTRPDHERKGIEPEGSNREGADRDGTESIEWEGVAFFRGLFVALGLSVVGYAVIALVVLVVLALIR
jgi:hypothetical protein